MSDVANENVTPPATGAESTVAATTGRHVAPTAGEDAAETPRFPETMAELKAANPIVARLPELVSPGELSVSQSADFSIVDTFLRSKLDDLIPKPDEQDDDGSKLVERQVLAARLLDSMNAYYRDLASDKDAYDQAFKGLDANAVFWALCDLVVFYRLALGKSTDSVVNSTSAKSN
ncbi:hypothetical protein [Bifidobacterium tissieri]|uniref:Uncharacterized protein n=1 Tax=Bifidobacterium tissieri TaxID=1630162 RepID=A0A5M9ZXS1_9BIFI|nr:hypothetical protein [Bifidobacterium tissieri]KAA8829339.1 hypothetical protein EM849_11065 [Bifidobacterium tissieri]KAA8831652.1 hypothetical protein EMO89_02705 [Bifidobacterium tissieri]